MPSSLSDRCRAIRPPAVLWFSLTDFAHQSEVSALQSSYAQADGGGLWTILNRFLAILIVVTGLAVVLYRYFPDLGKSRDQEARIAALTSQIDEQRQLLSRQTLVQNLLVRDPEYVGLIARDKLDLMKEGETIYRIEPPRPDPSRMHLQR
jgi:cell division protein FtsB